MLRKLAAEHIDQYGDSLTLILHGIAESYVRFHDLGMAIQYRIEAVGVWRNRAAQNPDVYYPHLASALEAMAHWASTNELHTEALGRQCEAVNIWRRLAAEDIDKCVNSLALALNRMAGIYLRLCDSAAALKCRIEALDVWRNCAAQNPDRHYPHLARAYGETADWASRNQFHTEALDYRREAVAIWRKLVAQDSNRFSFDLKTALRMMNLEVSKNQPTPDKTWQSQPSILSHRSLDGSSHPLSQHSDCADESLLSPKSPRDLLDPFTFLTPYTIRQAL